MMDTYAIEMRDIDISFGDFQANKKVTLQLKKGEILALLGENGAGKSTLMKILYGLYKRDAGEIYINSTKMPKNYSPQIVIGMGVSMVAQQIMQVDAFSVAENIILGMEKASDRFLFRKRKIVPLVQELCDKYKIQVPLEQNIAGLSLGLKQKVEILKALYRGGEVIILDEPTTILTPQETEELFALLRNLKKQGLSIIIIAHKLKEVLAVSDRIMVMRLGEKVADVKTSETNTKELASLMVGRDVETVRVKSKDDRVSPYITFNSICTDDQIDHCSLRELTLDLYPGRIVGIAGINGNGQTELVEVLAGIRKLSSGSITFGDVTISENKPAIMSERGIGIIPEDRREQGLVLDLTIRDNIIIGERKSRKFSKYGIFMMKAVNSFVKNKIIAFDVRPNKSATLTRFVSGGNQQKIVLARELSRDNLELIVADQPIRGLDIGAIAFTHSTLLDFRDAGKTLLLISADLDEIRELSDFIAVLHDGKIVSFKPASEISNEEIGLLMGGEHIQGDISL